MDFELLEFTRRHFTLEIDLESRILTSGRLSVRGPLYAIRVDFSFLFLHGYVLLDRLED